jgi:hypothetical protein
MAKRGDGGEIELAQGADIVGDRPDRAVVLGWLSDLGIQVSEADLDRYESQFGAIMSSDDLMGRYEDVRTFIETPEGDVAGQIVESLAESAQDAERFRAQFVEEFRAERDRFVDSVRQDCQALLLEVPGLISKGMEGVSPNGFLGFGGGSVARMLLRSPVRTTATEPQPELVEG